MVIGQPQSKANSRRLVVNKGVPMFIKSGAALSYERTFALQCPKLNPMFLEDVAVEMEIYYASRRPDLDESIILDGMQGRIYINDRQVAEKHVRKFIDKGNPRCIVRVSPVEGGDSTGGS
jgi:Holliday junction resolvase RusA-like endonuclease